MLQKLSHGIKRPFAISVEIAQNRLKRVNTQSSPDLGGVQAEFYYVKRNSGIIGISGIVWTWPLLLFISS